MTRSFAGVAVLAIALGTTAFSQCPPPCPCPNDASIEKLGQPCGGPPGARLNSTLPILGQATTIYVTSDVANGPVYLVSSPPPSTPSTLPGGCPFFIDLEQIMVNGPFTTNAFGALTFTFTNPSNPSLCGLTCNIQAGVVMADLTVRVSNGLRAIMGCDPGGPRNQIPNDGYCSYSKGGFSGNGTPGQIVNNNYTTVFPDGLEVGDFFPGNGNAAPNGLTWTSNAAGRTALKTYLLGGSSSGAFTSDQTNPTSGFGGGVFGRQTAALSLNVAFNDANLTNSQDLGFADLIFLKTGNSLSGLSVRQVLDVANVGLAGGGLPSGYTFTSLKDLVEDLNLSFCDCCQSDWSKNHLFRP